MTITLNPAIDLHFDLPSRGNSKIIRAAGVSRAAGGKGLNVARMLAVLGTPATAAVALGGPDAEVYRSLLEGASFEYVILDSPGPTRTNITLAESAGRFRMKINQAGPVWRRGDWPPIRERLATLARGRDWVVLAGTPPPGLPANAYRELIADARKAGARTAIDAAGEPLLRALNAKPELVRINREELAETLGTPKLKLRPERDVIEKARELIRRGARMVVVADGSKAACLVTEDEAWRAVPPKIIAQTAMGGGDSMMAGLVAIFSAAAAKEITLRTILRHGIAAGAARMECPEGIMPTHVRIRALNRRIKAEQID